MGSAMQITFQEIKTYSDPSTDREAQIGTYDNEVFVVYYYLYGTAVDRSYHDDVQSAINTALDYFNRSTLNGRPEIMDSGSC